MKNKNIELDDIKISQRSKKYEFGQMGNFIFSLLLIYFLFFGYICFIYDKEPGDNLLFVYNNFFNNYVFEFHDEIIDFFSDNTNLTNTVIEISYPSYYTLIILILIGTLQGYREDFLVYSIKYNLWMIPFILLFSWTWYAINYHITFIELFPFGTTVIVGFFFAIGQYFSSIQGLINIIILIVVYVGAGFLGGFLKSLRFQIIKKQETFISSNKNGVKH